MKSQKALDSIAWPPMALRNITASALSRYFSVTVPTPPRAPTPGLSTITTLRRAASLNGNSISIFSTIFPQFIRCASMYWRTFDSYTSLDNPNIFSACIVRIKACISSFTAGRPFFGIRNCRLIIPTGISRYSSLIAALAVRNSLIFASPSTVCVRPSANIAFSVYFSPYRTSMIELVHWFSSIGMMSFPRYAFIKVDLPAFASPMTISTKRSFLTSSALCFMCFKMVSYVVSLLPLISSTIGNNSSYCFRTCSFASR